MPRSIRPCSTPGCDDYATGSSQRCELHESRALRDRVAASRGYKAAAHTVWFRRGVLDRDVTCQAEPSCTEPATVADHWPLTRRQLVAQGLDPDDPANGRGLCAQHHNAHTGRTSPGGWAER